MNRQVFPGSGKDGKAGKHNDKGHHLMKKTWVGLALLSALFLYSCLWKPLPFDDDLWRERVQRTDPALLYASHFRDGRYFNPWMPMEKKSLLTLLRWRFTEKRSYMPEEEGFLPTVIPDLPARIGSLPGDTDFIVWIGHGTFLIRLDGEYWITDPMFSERALLPKRHTPPAMTLEEFRETVPKVNVILSHNHYDHMDMKSLEAMPPGTRYYVSRGLGASIGDLGNEPVVHEMDWWQSLDGGNGTTVICLPAQHWSRRITEGTNRTLWASFLIVTPDVTIYYGADSGYFIGYREIGKRYPGIDYALLPTTAYHPRWFMHYAHVNVAEALDAFSDLKAGHFIPTQWGTFKLGDEPPGFPALELQRVVSRRNLDKERFHILDLGEILPISKNFPGGS